MKYKEEPLINRMRGATRGRGANPQKGKPSTEPSQRKLEFQSDKTPFGPKLDYEKMKESLKAKFGLIISLLYNPSRKPPEKRLERTRRPNCLKDYLNLKKINLNRTKGRKVTIFNCGSFCSNIYLKMVKGDPPEVSLDLKLRKRCKVD
jgi:hypothetical protein